MREKVWLENRLYRSEGWWQCRGGLEYSDSPLPLAQAIFEPSLFPYKYPNISQPQSFFIPTCLWRWNRRCVPKRRHIKFRRRGITQKKAYNIQNKAKVWNQENLFRLCQNLKQIIFLFLSLCVFSLTPFLVRCPVMGQISDQPPFPPTPSVCEAYPKKWG